MTQAKTELKLRWTAIVGIGAGICLGVGFVSWHLIRAELERCHQLSQARLAQMQQVCAKTGRDAIYAPDGRLICFRNLGLNDLDS